MAGVRAADSPTLPELTARVQSSAPLPAVQPPAPQQTLRSYIRQVGGGRSVSGVMEALGYSPTLADRVDQRLQAMPATVIDRIAQYLQVPRQDVLWACGGLELVAPALGLGRRPLWPNKTLLRSPRYPACQVASFPWPSWPPWPWATRPRSLSQRAAC